MSKKYREVFKVLKSKPTLEGAGVRLRRAFGYAEVPLLDPFLLFDHFGSDNPDDYLAGFPWHPHRGIETVTYMISGVVEHGDSLGNRGTIRSGDVQWMTAGSGIIHQEMPQRWEGRMQGFQLWVNLPAASKMMAPRYRDVTKEQILEVADGPGTRVKVIAGTVGKTAGPVRDIVVPIEYMDVRLAAGATFSRSLPRKWKAFAYVYSGAGHFTPDAGETIGSGELAVFAEGGGLKIAAAEQELCFLLACGQPLNEPVAWGGPIVMNTQEELELAFAEYRNGTFIKQR